MLIQFHKCYIPWVHVTHSCLQPGSRW